jgi:L-asparagine oxygenase
MRPLDAEELWGAIGQLIDSDLETFTPDEFVDLALAVPPLLPPDVHRRVIEYRRRAPNGDVLLLRGLLPSGVVIPPTVTSSSALPSGPAAQSAALLLVGVTVMLGEPFNYASLWEGRLVQNLIPVRGKEFTQTSQSSRGLLDWHVEDGFREDRCDYAGLLCLRGDPAGASKYAQAKDLQLSPDLAATLRETRFQLRPDPAHILPVEVTPRRIAVLTGSESEPEICYDTHHITPIDDADTAAAAALRELHAHLDKVQMSHVMERGDLLIFDNRRVVHARAPFTARFDGTDRWLMRTMVCGSAVRFRRWGRRIPE